MTADLVTRRAGMALSSFDPEALTATAVLSSFADVERGVYIERLPASGLRSADLSGLPVLDGHDATSSRSVVGRIESSRIDNGQLVGVIRFSAASDVADVVTKVREGCLRGVSVGCRVHRWQKSNANGRVIRTAAEYEIQEISIVPIPADPASTFRGENMDAPQEDTIQHRAAVREIARRAGLSPEWADEQIDSGDDLTTVRSAAFEAMESKPRPTIRTAAPQPESVTRAAQADALAYRMAGGELPETARRFASMSMLDHAAASLERAGQSTRGLTADEILTRSTLATSDFPSVVQDAFSKVALTAYRAAESPLKKLARKRVLRDFKPTTNVRLSGLGTLEPMTEAGEFTHGARTEDVSALQLTTYGKALNLTRQLIVNDDAGLLGDMVSAFAQAAANTEAEALARLVTDPFNLSDDKAVFHADRGNTGTDALTTENIAAARQTMRGIRDADGVSYLGVTPRYLVVGPEQELAAERLLAAITATTTAEVNPLAGKLELIVEDRITDDSWFVAADPARFPGLVYAHLAGAEGVQVQQEQAWTTLGVKYRAWLDLGVGWADWRAWHRNVPEAAA